MVEQTAAEIGEWPEDGDCEQEGNPPPEDRDAFVVGGDAEVENESRDGDSVVSGVSTIPTEDRNSFVSDMSSVETDPAAPRVATIVVMRTAARLSMEAARCETHIRQKPKPSTVLGCPLLSPPKTKDVFNTPNWTTSRARRLTDLIFGAKTIWPVQSTPEMAVFRAFDMFSVQFVER
ncbi:hypothetical protein LY76DRAFT_645479 [Colletotrichum caudatum]|nr:hypothetical protein LY76DRAFT_645479 [Colletotrichum caudatum]